MDSSHLVRLGYLKESQLTALLERQLDVPSVTSLGSVAPEVLGLVSRATARNLWVIPLETNGDRLRLAMVNPGDGAAIRRVQYETGRVVEPVAAPELVVQYALGRFYGVQAAPRVNPGVIEHMPITDSLPTPDLETADLSRAMKDESKEHAHLAERMLRAHGEREVIDELLAEAVQRGGGFVVFRVDGREVVPHSVPGASLAIHSSPVIRAAVSSRRIQRGRLVEDKSTSALSHVLGPWAQTTVRAIPVVVQNHVHSVIVCEPRDDRTSEDSLRRVVEAGLELAFAKKTLMAAVEPPEIDEEDEPLS